MDEIAKTRANAAGFNADADNVFERIAERYDVLCDIFSLYAHRYWKRRMAHRICATRKGALLDVASGTGDIPLRVLLRAREKSPTSLMVTDLSPAMLGMAQRKLGVDDRSIQYQIQDAHDLIDIESNSMDIYSISFGMKILDRRRVISEAYRVLRNGGAFFCLEAARIPVEVVHRTYLRYMDWCVPLISRLATGGDRSAYQYLLRGVHDFPRQADFSKELESHGFTNVEYENLTLGIVAIHSAVKEEERGA